MKPINIILATFSAHMEVNLPSRLTAAGIDAIDTFISDGPPSNIDEKQCCTYLGTDYHDEESSRNNFMMQIQLPQILSPLNHKVEVDKSIKAFDTVSVNAKSLGWSSVAFYPGEIQDGGMSSFLVYEINLTDELDGCSDDDDDDY